MNGGVCTLYGVPRHPVGDGGAAGALITNPGDGDAIHHGVGGTGNDAVRPIFARTGHLIAKLCQIHGLVPSISYLEYLSIITIVGALATDGTGISAISYSKISNILQCCCGGSHSGAINPERRHIHRRFFAIHHLGEPQLGLA